ncbi:MAG: L-seryl-tRNA(Sec) selenium transferase, partial [Candidatus Cloacimonetes bacterium]|nr:L-seryl-tRNA(Sec) selenium transferase [Candidatus Cloacimonadota bacterium]
SIPALSAIFYIKIGHKMDKIELRKIPGVDTLMKNSEIKKFIADFGEELTVFSIRQVLNELRDSVLKGKKIPSDDKIYTLIEQRILNIGTSSLKPMINATGVVLHTNLGRAPLGSALTEEVSRIIEGYSNLEFDLEKGKRGHREDHITDLITFITGAEDAVVVNNNAAGVFLSLNTLCSGKEAMISRGELIEIGGSFRIPDIMQQSGAKMTEVGTTNRTRLTDYEAALSDETAVLFKAHKSNYYIEGFSEDVEIGVLAELAHAHGLVCIFDMGSGLLRKPKGLPLETEPDVHSALRSGADLVMFSCDKLLGGPQAGIIAGKKELIQKLKKSPLMRVLRVGKMTLAALSKVVRCYLKDETLLENVPVFLMLNQKKDELHKKAEKFSKLLSKENISNQIIDNIARCGGGTLPQVEIPSYAVQLQLSESKISPEQLYHKLLHLDKPILGILREGSMLFDVFTLNEKHLPDIAEKIKIIITS